MGAISLVMLSLHNIGSQVNEQIHLSKVQSFLSLYYNAFLGCCIAYGRSCPSSQEQGRAILGGRHYVLSATVPTTRDGTGPANG
jgi:hypothetical protein